MPALLAAEPNSSAAAEPAASASISPAELADQAALVQQIGSEAARGFDAEAHARALRQQIEVLVAAPTAAAAATAPTRILPAGRPTPLRTAAVAPMSTEPAKLAGNSAIRMAIEKMRAAIEELEAQLKGK
jgi:hypothetical protein